MRYGFITCVELGRGCINEILDIGGHLEFIGTLHDDLAINKAGRVYLDAEAERAGVHLTKFHHVNDKNAQRAIANASLDWLFIIGWSQIASRAVLELPREGVLGMHPTLLPEGRGRASIPWAIIKGLSRTGVTLFKLAEAVDSGDVLAQHEVELSASETASTLYPRIVEAHRALIRNVWPGLERGAILLIPQDEDRATFWPGRRPEDGLLAAQSMSVEDFDRHVRALTHPYPGAFIESPTGPTTIWAGHPWTPMCGCGSELTIECRDGVYCVVDCEPRLSGPSK